LSFKYLKQNFADVLSDQVNICPIPDFLMHLNGWPKRIAPSGKSLVASRSHPDPGRMKVLIIPRKSLGSKRGFTLIELLVVIAIIAILGVALIPLLFSSTESRLLQESMSQVETNGSQMMQIIGRKIREADRIVYPPKGQVKPVLVLQTSSGGLTPTTFGLLTGALLMIERTQSQRLSGNEVAVESFSARNTGNGTSTGVSISFTIARTLRLSAPRQYRQTFQTFFSLYPKDILSDCDCDLVTPLCTAGNTHFSWGVSTTAICGSTCTITSPIQLDCQ